jgi:class 3 adenylate cyclase/TolB-like protein
MPEQTHQLAAIMFTDIVGYTALMGENEGSAYKLLKKNRQVQKPSIEKHNGTWLKEMGDGVLASFQTITDAVYCAIEIQLICKKEPELKLRIGIHLGEVLVEDGDVFGDGVNIASRLEPLAPAGGIYVSESVFRNVQNKEGIKADFVREETLKNVKYPVRIYEVKIESDEAESQLTSPRPITPTEPNKSSNFRKGAFVSLAIIIILFLSYFYYFKPANETPSISTVSSENKELSIAVLPFKNYSGDPDHEPFCNAMTDAVISRLTKLKGIDKVISMTSVLSYKQTQKTMPEIATELGVTHILEASFQKSGNQIKINLQLIDGPSDNHFWSSEYNGEWDIGIFSTQAEVAENVAVNMGAQITDSEIETIQKMPTNNEEAYNLFIQAEYQRNKSNEAAFENAIPLYEQAIALDSNFAEAYLGLSAIWNTGGLVWGIYNEREAWKNAKQLLQKAIELDSTNVSAFESLYLGYFYYDWDFELAENYYQTIRHKPISYNSAGLLVDYPIKTGRYNEALELINNRILFDPSIGNSYAFKAEILMFQGKKKEAIEFLESHDPLYNDDYFYLRESAKHYYYLGEYKKSKSHLNRMMLSFPDEDPPILFWLNVVHHQMDGNNEGVAKYLGKLIEKYQNNASGSPAWFIALYYCHIKDYENAFEWLQKSYDRHEVEMTWFREEPLLIPIRNDPRYKELYLKIGFSGL